MVFVPVSHPILASRTMGSTAQRNNYEFTGTLQPPSLAKALQPVPEDETQYILSKRTLLDEVTEIFSRQSVYC
jgi:hypothetical protein